MHSKDVQAHRELRDTPRRRQTPQWLPPRTYISLVDVLFVCAALLTAAWFLGEFGEELWSFISSTYHAAMGGEPSLKP